MRDCSVVENQKGDNPYLLEVSLRCCKVSLPTERGFQWGKPGNKQSADRRYAFVIPAEIILDKTGRSHSLRPVFDVTLCDFPAGEV